MRSILSVLMLTLMLSACGFHLRGEGAFALPFQSVYINSPNDYTPFINELKQDLRANNVQVANSSKEAQLTLQIVFEKTDKQILTLSAAGRVLEYRLQYRVSLRAYDKNVQEWLVPREITFRRDFPYDDTQVLAKEQEEAMLYTDMRHDAVQQVLRLLARAKPVPSKD